MFTEHIINVELYSRHLKTKLQMLALQLWLRGARCGHSRAAGASCCAELPGTSALLLIERMS